MTRLASIEKAGFYPTPPSVFERIAGHVLPSQFGGRLLDPCSGDGIPAQHLARSWGLEAYGIEIDRERASASVRVLRRVLHLDYAQARIPHDSFQVLYLNPPYDYDESSFRRLEYKFLREITKWLQTGGILVFLIPRYRLDQRMARFLAANYSQFAIYRFPDPEYAHFRQIVLFAVRTAGRFLDASAAQRLSQVPLLDLPILPAQSSQPYAIPRLKPVRFYFRGTEIDPQGALEAALAEGVWGTRAWAELLDAQQSLASMRPVLPLKKGHLAMLIAAGLMKNLVLEHGGERRLVKGRTRKVQITHIDHQEKVEIVRDRFVTEITSLDLTTGDVDELSDEEDLRQFMERWQPALAQRVLETFRPLYEFDFEREAPEVLQLLSSLSRYRRLPGRSTTGLFETQKHVSVALWRRLQEANYAICVGEMGVGKTTIAVTVSRLLDSRATIVVCPPHLVEKWVREIHGIVPLATAVTLRRFRDVDRFAQDLSRTKSGLPIFAVVSREMAKLGSGWRAAPIPKRLAFSKDGSEPTTVFQCPRCGSLVREVERGMEGPIVSDAAYFTRKRKCSQCAEPLYQMVHLNSDSSNSYATWLEQREERGALLPPAPNGRPRYPIADYIARRYPRLFDLLIVDEVHQYKGQSTDQGYAMGALVRACRKTLALTGTIFGGRATSLFYLLFRLSPEVRAHFRWSDGQAWAERYGILEKITKLEDYEAGHGYFTGKRRRKTLVRELPGVSPELVMLLLDSTTFVRLSDLGYTLPPLVEKPAILEMDPDQRAAYDSLRDRLETLLRERLSRGDQRLLGAYLQSLLSYPNACFREEVVRDPDGNEVARAPALGEERLYPKEGWLVDLAKEERKKRRKMLVYCRQTATRDITFRLRELLEDAGLTTAILSADVDTQRREAWLKNRSRGLDVLITNPRLVETGLDLVDFQTVVFYELDYSLYTMMQAARRTWRLGQTDEVHVHYAVYRDTMEYRAMTLIAQKLAAALLLYGDAVEGALVHEGEREQAFLADLARSVIEKAEVPDLNRLFEERAQVGEGAASDYLSWRQPVPEGKREEGQDTLTNIQPSPPGEYEQLHLID